ncbi:MAG: ribonuclease P protein component [Flavobacteriales bacterium]|nr:ribonuclease P protein component [Flavobacteriales bacterium]
MSNTLNKTERLKSEKIIKHIFSNRKSVACQPLRLIWSELENLPCHAACFSVSKRNFKHAVDRNRVKRLLREVYRTHRDIYTANTEKKYGFIIIYNCHELPTYDQIENKMEKMFSFWNEKIKKC